MQLLEKRFAANLKTWTSSESEFKGNTEDLVREAELVAVIANFLNEEGMPDRDDDEYRAFTAAMTNGAKMIAGAARQEDLSTAQKGAGIISQACAQCHESYR
jgi:exosome complex RNA-binding protein Csl4